jgi:lysophospholipase L1-like esterase
MTVRPILTCVALSFTISAIGGEGASTAFAKDLSSGGVVLLLGDSILDCHEGEKRIEFVMQRLLQQAMPHARWTIFNEAHGGEYIGPKVGNPAGVSEPLFGTEITGRIFEILGRHLQADAVIINYAANDSKVYPPAVFRKRLEELARLIEEKYPGAVIVMSTSMYLDPHHSAPYHIENPQSPGFKDGDLRNVYLEPYNREIRDLAAVRGYRLADTYRRLTEETARGNWDLRLRADEGDPNGDPKHAGDMRWFDNIHPNDQGTKIIAEGLVEALLRHP